MFFLYRKKRHIKLQTARERTRSSALADGKAAVFARSHNTITIIFIFVFGNVINLVGYLIGQFGSLTPFGGLLEIAWLPGPFWDFWQKRTRKSDEN